MFLPKTQSYDMFLFVRPLPDAAFPAPVGPAPNPTSQEAGRPLIFQAAGKPLTSQAVGKPLTSGEPASPAGARLTPWT